MHHTSNAPSASHTPGASHTPNTLSMHHRHRRTLTPAALAAFQAQFGARFLTSDAVREHHGTDESPYPVCPPDAVIFPRDIDDVVAVVRLCGQYGVPVIPFGIGSSLEGHVLPVEGGITLDFAEMDKVLALTRRTLR